jgi:hypothetical protein
LIHKTIAFYLENQAEIDAFLADYAAALDSAKSASAAKHLDVAALRARLSDQERRETAASVQSS